jgi:hypothetical protein
MLQHKGRRPGIKRNERYTGTGYVKIAAVGHANNHPRSLTPTQIYWLRKAHLAGVACVQELRAWSGQSWGHLRFLIYGVKP